MFRPSLSRFVPLGMVLGTSLSLGTLAACGGGYYNTPVEPTEPTEPVETPAAPYPTEVTATLGLPQTPNNYARITLPAHFNTNFVRGMDNTPTDNPITDQGATLGRVLFYDTKLSANSTVACASCHVQSKGFSDNDTFSRGFAGGLTGRNSMPIANARYYRNGNFFWDERAPTLEDQVLMPIQNSVEMGLTLEELVQRVTAQPYYAELFNRAFGSTQVTSDRISRAMAQFVRSILAYRSRFDQGLAAAGDVQATFANFTAQENRGKELFMGPAGCATCHLDNPPPPPGQPPPPRGNQAVFFVNRATNNGLSAGADIDNGIGDLTGAAADQGRFKSPALHNVALTAPYMHDGRFATLTEVVEHYNSNVQPHPNLDNRLKVPGTNTPRRLNLSQPDVAALVAFMGTLTDDELNKDARYADPFLPGQR
jgi:cytochrome c peroxidase